MAGLSSNTRGAFLMMASMAGFTLNDVCMKSLAGALPLSQAVFLRGIVAVGLIYLLARRAGALRFNISRRDWWLIALRSLAEVVSAWLFLSALFHMPIANATAILQALPLSVSLAGALFFREAIGPRRMLAMLIGFVGVLLIVQPGAEGFNIYSIHAVLAVMAVTFRDLAARRLSPQVPSLLVALVASAAVAAIFGLWALLEGWQPVEGSSMALLVAAALFVVGGYLFSVMTMRVGEIAAVTPFRYTSLLWALVLGLVVFGEWPDSMALSGALIVVLMGLWTLMRERERAQP